MLKFPICLLYSLRKKYYLTVKNADSDFLMFTLMQLLQLIGPI